MKGHRPKLRVVSETQIGIVQSDVLAFVSRVQSNPTLVKIAQKTKMVFPLYNEEINFIVRADSDLNYVHEIRDAHNVNIFWTLILAGFLFLTYRGLSRLLFAYFLLFDLGLLLAARMAIRLVFKLTREQRTALLHAPRTLSGPMSVRRKRSPLIAERSREARTHFC